MAARATMATVAEIAGVSVPTVSKVLAGKPDISEDTRIRVANAVRATGYLVRGGRRRLAGGMVDLLLDGVATPVSGEIVGGAERAAFEMDLTLTVTSTSHPRFRIQDWVEHRRARPTVGVVLVLFGVRRREIRALRELSAPLVLVDAVGAHESGLPAVGATNWAGGLAATRHLLGLGHRRVGFVGGPVGLPCVRERQEGYLAAHREAGIAPDPRLIRSAEFTVAEGARHGGTLLDADDPPTAIFACSDAQAAGVYQAAAVRNLRIPRDLSVVGFDDTPICELLAPPLTTVRQPLADMAAEAVRLVAEEHRYRGAAAGRQVELATSLVGRASTAGRRGPGTKSRIATVGRASR